VKSNYINNSDSLDKCNHLFFSLLRSDRNL